MLIIAPSKNIIPPPLNGNLFITKSFSHEFYIIKCTNALEIKFWMIFLTHNREIYFYSVENEEKKNTIFFKYTRFSSRSQPTFVVIYKVLNVLQGLTRVGLLCCSWSFWMVVVILVGLHQVFLHHAGIRKGH